MRYVSGMSIPPPGPAAVVSLDFERPLADVRALLFDVDLLVREKPHRGTRLQWITRAPGEEQRLRQTQRVLERLQSEDVVIEAGLNDTWVKRFVVGPNAGTRFVASFEARGDAETRVRMEAFTGPNGFAQGLGKLSAVGLEKSMKRLLGEYKRALEGYEPGRARGAVEDVIGGWGDVTASLRALDPARRKALISTLLETAWSIAAVDDTVDLAERDAMRAVVASLWLTPIDADTEERMVRAVSETIAKQGIATRCVVLGERLKTLGFGELGVALSVLVAEVSHGLDPAELEALQQLATAAGIAPADLLDIIYRTDSALSGGERMSRMSVFI